MRWFADECVHAPVVRELRDAGHDVVYAAEAARQTEDVVLAQQATRDDRILLTEDKDFGEISFIGPVGPRATVLLRFPSARREMKWPRLREAIVKHGERLSKSFTVIDEARIRIRPIGSDDNHT
jgi:predicted nuclease of predicted toxin-antitoxin system